ncbi:transposase, Mutator family protein [Corynebacterium simulans]|nr:transposase, Mutator family protein [Corynebacterium simulans]
MINKSAYMAIGVDIEAIKHILGLWIAKEEGVSFWAQVSSNLSNRGVKNVLIVCCDGLKAYLTRSPGFMVQTCVVHLIRAANRWVAYGDRKKVSAALKKVIYTTNSIESFNNELRKATRNRVQPTNDESAL